MTNLKQARTADAIEQFVKDREADKPGDKRAFDRTIQAMAGKSKPAPGTSKPRPRDD